MSILFSCALLVEDSIGTFLYIYLEFGPLVPEKMSFKDISTFSSGSNFSLTAEWKDSCIFRREYYLEYPVRLVFEFEPVVQPEMSGGHFVQLRRTVSESLFVRGHYVKHFCENI